VDVDPGDESDGGRMAFKPGREPRGVDGAAAVEAELAGTATLGCTAVAAGGLATKGAMAAR